MQKFSLAALLISLGCGGEASDSVVEPLPFLVRSPTGLVTLEWNPSQIIQRIDGFLVQKGAVRSGPFEDYYFLDHQRRAVVDIGHVEGERAYYRLQGLQGSRLVAESEVTAAASTEILPTTSIESSPTGRTQANTVTVAFSGESLLHGELHQFTMHLDDEPWSQPKEATEIELVGLGVGRHVFEVRAMDNVGNLDPTPARVEFIVDLANSPRILIDNGDIATSNREVALQLGATGGVVEMKLSENQTLSGAEWQPFQNGTTFTLSEAEGAKTIFTRFKLENGNETATVGDTIILDRTAPQGVIGFPTPGAAFYQDSVTIYGYVEDSSPVVARSLSVVDEALAGTFSLVEVPMVIGDNDLVVELEDAVGLKSTLTVTVWRHPATGACAF